MGMKKFILFFIALTILVLSLSGCAAPLAQSAAGGGSELKLEFTLLDVNNNEVSLSDYEGKTVLINFFGTWCAPCRREMPDFVEVYSVYKDRNVEFIGIAVNSDLAAVKDFIDEFGIEFPVLMDGSLESVAAKVGIRAIPSTLLLDEEQNALVGFTGLLTKAQLIDMLEDALNQ
jgi:thiol-disulfide isomerase/thioredoxin